VVAAADIQVGRQTGRAQSSPRDTLPQSAVPIRCHIFRQPKTFGSRPRVFAIGRGDLCSAGKLAAGTPGRGFALDDPQGMRAVSVRVNEVVSVASDLTTTRARM